MFKTVMIPVDVSDTTDTETLLAAARTLTAGWDATLHVVTVVPDFGMAIVGSYFDDKFESASHTEAEVKLTAAIADAGLDANHHVLHGKIYDRLIAHAKMLDADLILIGAHQPALGDYLLGSNAARIVRHAKQSVMVLRT